MRLTEQELADLTAKNPALKEKINKAMLAKPRGQLTEYVPITADEKTLLEKDIQAAYFDWVLNPSNNLIMLDLSMIYAIPNGSNKSKTERWLHQITGLRSGVPDIHIPVSRKPFFSMYIEVKRWAEFKRKNHGCSDNQLLWHHKLRKHGHKVIVEWSVMSLIKLTKEYLGYES